MTDDHISIVTQKPIILVIAYSLVKHPVPFTIWWHMRSNEGEKVGQYLFSFFTCQYVLRDVNLSVLCTSIGQLIIQPTHVEVTRTVTFIAIFLGQFVLATE